MSKRLCGVLLMVLMISIGAVTVCGDSLESEIYTHHRFISNYEDLCNKVLEVQKMKISDVEKESKLKLILDKYVLEDKYERNRCMELVLKNETRSMIERCIKSMLSSGLDDHVWAVRRKYDKVIALGAEDLEAIIIKYHLDEDIRVEDIIYMFEHDNMKGLYSYVKNIFEVHKSEVNNKSSIDNLIMSMKSCKSSTEKKTLITGYLEANEIDKYTSFKEIDKIMSKAKGNQERDERVIKHIMFKFNEKKSSEYISNVSKELVKILDNELYKLADEKMYELLDSNWVGHTYHSRSNILYKVISYKESGFKDRESAIESLIYSKLKYKYTEAELMRICEDVVGILDKYCAAEVSREKILKECDFSINNCFKDVFEDLGLFKDIEEIKNNKRLLEAYLDHETLGFSTEKESIRDYLRYIVYQSPLKDKLLSSIKNNKGDIDSIYKEVKEAIDGEDGFIKVVHRGNLGKLLSSSDRDKYNKALSIIMDGVIDSREDAIDDIVFDMEHNIVAINKKSADIDVHNFIRSKGISKNVNPYKIVEDYLVWKTENKDIFNEIYNKYFKQYIDNNNKSKAEINKGIDNIINDLENKRLNRYEMDKRAKRFVNAKGIGNYVLVDDIINAYINPVKWGYSDVDNAMHLLLKSGMEKKLKEDIQLLKGKKLDKKQELKRLKILLKNNGYNALLTDRELYNTYLK